ncbi:protein FAM47E [Peromyscus leucopus]|uniref:protein FAM47E n=1 Tax=Peromyscus leucopus TaxID=10041 RepID=UPI0010A14837|nr:protein FAM47E [Peromyscus leucopus]
MAERGQRLQPTTLAPGLQQEHRNRGRYLENLPSKCCSKHKRLKFPGSLNSQHWVFVREELDDFRKGCCPRQRPKDVFLPHIHHRLPQATPKKRQDGLPKGAALLSKLSQARKAFLEDVEDNMALHPLALYPHLEEALPAELLLQVLEALDPERKLEDTWACRQDTRKLTKGPAKLEEKRPSQVCLPKKMPVSHSGQWLCEEKPSEANSLYKDSLLHDNIRRGVRDFCHWATALGSSPIDEEFILQQFDIDYQTRHSCDALPEMRGNQDKFFLDGQPSLREQSGCWNEPLPSGRTSPRKPKQVKMRFGAWYLKTNLWKKRRADEPLVDPKVSHKAQDAGFKKHPREQAELLTGLHGTAAFKDFILSRGYRMPRFLEKIYTEEKGKSEHIKTPKNLTERNPGRR